MEPFEAGLIATLEGQWARQGVDVGKLAADVAQGYRDGRVRNPNGCLVMSCRREASRLGILKRVQGEGPRAGVEAGGDYARFRWRLIGQVMRERVAPASVAASLRQACEAWPAYAADLAAEAALLEVFETWAQVGQATLSEGCG